MLWATTVVVAMPLLTSRSQQFAMLYTSPTLPFPGTTTVLPTHRHTPHPSSSSSCQIIHFNGCLKPWEDGAPKGGLEMMWWKRYLEMQTE